MSQNIFLFTKDVSNGKRISTLRHIRIRDIPILIKLVMLY